MVFYEDHEWKVFLLLQMGHMQSWIIWLLEKSLMTELTHISYLFGAAEVSSNISVKRSPDKFFWNI